MNNSGKSSGTKEIAKQITSQDLEKLEKDYHHYANMLPPTPVSTMEKVESGRVELCETDKKAVPLVFAVNSIITGGII